MSLILTPKATEELTAPAVGIFWRVKEYLVVERTVLSAAEPYGDCLTHEGGHYERWEAWQKLGAMGLRAAGLPTEIGLSEYDDWPRGRVVYEVSPQCFILYADRRLQRPGIIAVLLQGFGLVGADVAVRGDPHYRS